MSVENSWVKFTGVTTAKGVQRQKDCGDNGKVCEQFLYLHKLFDYVQKSVATETLHCELCVQARPSHGQDRVLTGIQVSV